MTIPQGSMCPTSIYFGLKVHPIGEFPKIRGTLFWGSYNKDPTI